MAVKHSAPGCQVLGSMQAGGVTGPGTCGSGDLERALQPAKGGVALVKYQSFSVLMRVRLMGIV